MTGNATGESDLFLETLHREQAAAIERVPEYPEGRFNGRGVVMLAGGEVYFTCAWVNLWLLRNRFGCDLPVELWYLHRDEFSPEMEDLVQRFDVTCIDASEVRQRHQYPGTTGWQNKVFAIIQSRFAEVLYLDADSAPMIEPSVAFDWPEYREFGALFWPDIHLNDPASRIWEICRLPFVPGPEFEAGQIVIDKQRCWQALNLVEHMNARADTYYQHLHGDKDTFQLAWRMLGRPFGLIAHPPRQVLLQYDPGLEYPGSVMLMLVQHAPDGNPAFFHRSAAKWNAWARLPDSPFAAFETDVAEALKRLRTVWSGRTGPLRAPSRVARTVEDISAVRDYEYWRVGRDYRAIQLFADGTIHGAGDFERNWRLAGTPSAPVLIISGDDAPTCRLRLDPDGVWRGRWRTDEQMPIELTPSG